MPDNNTDKVIDTVDKDTDKNLDKDIDLNNDNGDTAKHTVPLATFLKTKDELRDLKSRLDSYEKEKEKAEQDKKIAEGKKDEVINELTEKLKTFEVKAKQFDEYDKSKRDLLKKEIGDDNWLDSFTNLPLIDLEKLAVKFKPGVKLVDTDNGKNTKTPPKDYFTLDELKNFKQSDYVNLKPEERKKLMEKVNKSVEFHSKK